jgi:ABC-type multidrug transport system fused ATPase/permease subunit
MLLMVRSIIYLFIYFELFFEGILVLSAFVYFFLAMGMPFDWLIPKSEYSAIESLVASKADEVQFPCDHETSEELQPDEQEEILLNVNRLSHVYPDGTHAVKDISFAVKKGEVLSFLGANGAGKSTCMGMLCGTLEATFGGLFQYLS